MNIMIRIGDTAYIEKRRSQPSAISALGDLGLSREASTLETFRRTFDVVIDEKKQEIPLLRLGDDLCHCILFTHDRFDLSGRIGMRGAAVNELRGLAGRARTGIRLINIWSVEGDG